MAVGHPRAILLGAPCLLCRVQLFLEAARKMTPFIVSSGTWGARGNLQGKMLRSPGVRAPGSQKSIVHVLGISRNPPLTVPTSSGLKAQMWPGTGEERDVSKRERSPGSQKLMAFKTNHLLSLMSLGLSDLTWLTYLWQIHWTLAGLRRPHVGWLSSAPPGPSSPRRPALDSSHGNGRGPSEEFFKLLLAPSWLLSHYPNPVTWPSPESQ